MYSGVKDIHVNFLKKCIVVPGHHTNFSKVGSGAGGQNRTADTMIFSHLLYHWATPAEKTYNLQLVTDNNI